MFIELKFKLTIIIYLLHNHTIINYLVNLIISYIRRNSNDLEPYTAATLVKIDSRLLYIPYLGTSLGVIRDLWTQFFTCSQLVISMLLYLCENKMN